MSKTGKTVTGDSRLVRDNTVTSIMPPIYSQSHVQQQPDLCFWPYWILNIAMSSDAGYRSPIKACCDLTPVLVIRLPSRRATSEPLWCFCRVQYCLECASSRGVITLTYFTFSTLLNAPPVFLHNSRHISCNRVLSARIWTTFACAPWISLSRTDQF